MGPITTITYKEITDPGCPRLWNVYVNDEHVPSKKYGPSTHAVRVLQCGKRYLPINDNGFCMGSYPKMRQAARVAAGIPLDD